MKKLKLMADYDCSPIWLNDGDEFGDVPLRDLPISLSLRDKLYRWAANYDATLNLDDPSSSGFSSKEAENIFKKEGELLRAELEKELGSDYEIVYHA